MSTIHTYARLSADLVEALHLDHSPVAICFADTVPEGLDAPPKRVPAGCCFCGCHQGIWRS
jgi:hypothetical protein